MAEDVSVSSVAYRVTVAGSRGHGSLSDVPFLLPFVPMFAHGATIAPDRAWEIATVARLFDRHIKGAAVEFPAFPEVTIEVVDRR